ncbi:EAL domain-containing protein [Deinococcus sp. Arct2-2]|uniref:EAL domain-containing protein n=1 Tax=Deinococcus sp. Arct2-2 TaxID=2568653 RepID=UPI0010A3DC99|nr:EAL domain-containing protein [Deinococcus sp. Arct2-2]THF67742.1 EAL domain-containing protein [Deinococcus sp. Arct2-2]
MFWTQFSLVLEGVPHAAALIESVVALGTRLGLSVIAEGVETQEQLEQLVKLGCTQFQGYYVARPLTPDAFFTFAAQPWAGG